MRSVEVKAAAHAAAFAARKRAAALGIPNDVAEIIVGRGIETARQAAALAESPIEEALLAPLALADWHGFLTFPVPIFRPSDETPPDGDIMIVPQLRFARYRSDIGIVCPHRLGAKIFFVEADGFWFHDARSDLARDNYLGALGVTTIRLSGQRINRDIEGAVQTVVATVTAWKASQ